jgi:hypothetical protein
MCSVKPTTLEQFEGINGVGKVKVNKYGPQFVSEIVAHVGSGGGGGGSGGQQTLQFVKPTSAKSATSKVTSQVGPNKILRSPFFNDGSTKR